MTDIPVLPAAPVAPAAEAPTVAEIATPAPAPIVDPALDATAQLIAGLRAKVTAAEAAREAMRIERDTALTDLGAAETHIEELEDARDSLIEQAAVATTLLMERDEVPTPKRKEVCTLIQGLYSPFPEVQIHEDQTLAEKLNEGWDILNITVTLRMDGKDSFHDRIVTLVREVPAEPVQPQRAAAVTFVGVEQPVTFQTSTVSDSTPRTADRIIFNPERLEVLPVDEIDPNADDYVAKVIRSRMPAAEKMTRLRNHTLNRIVAHRPAHAPFTPSAIPVVR